MVKNIRPQIDEMIETIEEGIMYLKDNNDENVRESIALGRKSVEDTLSKVIGVSISDRIESKNISDEEWISVVKCILDDIQNPLAIHNTHDKKFLNLLSYIWKTSIDDMVTYMKDRLNLIKDSKLETYNNFVDYFAKYKFWGTLIPDKNDYTTLRLRAEVLKQKSYIFLWLYKRMEDYISKRTLYAIMLNWAILDINELAVIKSSFDDYYEPDIFMNNKNDVFVDLGAFIGDSIFSYINNYGENYKKIYAYEVSKKNFKTLQSNMNSENFSNIILKNKAVGKENGYMFIEEHEDSSSIKINNVGDENNEVEVVTIDNDIDDDVTFIKMDIEGAEQDAILGCKNTIQKNHPKLAICTYHGYEDIWKIPLLINDIDPSYKFYFRHYGGNLIPTEFVLLCK